MKDQFSFVYVEDDHPSRLILEILMDDLDYNHLTTFENSVDFIARSEAVTPLPNVFLLDIHVKPHNGFEMLQMIRAHPQFAGTVVVALTASVMSEEVEQLKHAGFDGVISKPVSIHTFSVLLEKMLNGEKIWRIE